jgi:hypothetical protein
VRREFTRSSQEISGGLLESEREKAGYLSNGVINNNLQNHLKGPEFGEQILRM